MNSATKSKFYRLKNKLKGKMRGKIAAKIQKRKQRLRKKEKTLKNKELSETVNQSDKNSPISNLHSFKKCKTVYHSASLLFCQLFEDNTFGHACSICDRLWFKNDLEKISKLYHKILSKTFVGEDISKFYVCQTCRQCLSKKREIPLLSRSNGFQYPAYPEHLPKLNCIARRLISPRIFFRQIRRIRYQNSSQKLIGQIINIPVDVEEMVHQQPRNLDEDFAINVHFKKHILHKSSYLQGYVKKSMIKTWLEYLVDTPLYQDIQIKSEVFQDSYEDVNDYG